MKTQKILTLSLSILLFLAASFIAYSWNEPTTVMPNSYTSPINTSGTAQLKNGDFGATSFIDTNDSNYYINPSGNSVVSGKIVSNSPTSAGDISGTIATKGYVDTAGGLPAGAIIMFKTTCPSGWTRETSLDGRYPQGSTLYGTTGNAGTHTHTTWGCGCGPNISTSSANIPYINVIWCIKN